MSWSINRNYITHPPSPRPLPCTLSTHPLPSFSPALSLPPAVITAQPVHWQCYRSPEASSHRGAQGGWRRPRCAAVRTSRLVGRRDEEKLGVTLQHAGCISHVNTAAEDVGSNLLPFFYISTNEKKNNKKKQSALLSVDLFHLEGIERGK